MTLLDELKDQNNKIYLSTYGAIFALGFAGSEGFINRTYNMAYNHSIANGELTFLENGFYYCLATKDKLAKGLKNYFINEIKFTREIPPVSEGYLDYEVDGKLVTEYNIEYNEPEIEKLAEEKTLLFLQNNIVVKNFMMAIGKSLNNDFYELSKPAGRTDLKEVINNFSVV